MKINPNLQIVNLENNGRSLDSIVLRALVERSETNIAVAELFMVEAQQEQKQLSELNLLKVKMVRKVSSGSSSFLVPQELSYKEINLLKSYFGESLFNQCFGCKNGGPRKEFGAVIPRKQKQYFENFDPNKHDKIEFRAPDGTRVRDLGDKQTNSKETVMSKIDNFHDQITSMLNMKMLDLENIHSQYSSTNSMLGNYLIKSYKNHQVINIGMKQ